MITAVEVSFYCSGDELVPSSLPLWFSMQHDPGEIVRRGIHEGKAYGFGLFRVDVPDDVPPEEKIGFVSTFLTPVLDVVLDPRFQRWIDVPGPTWIIRVVGPNRSCPQSRPSFASPHP